MTSNYSLKLNTPLIGDDCKINKIIWLNKYGRNMELKGKFDRSHTGYNIFTLNGLSDEHENFIVNRFMIKKTYVSHS